MPQLQKYKDHFLLFCEAGFIAVNQADEDAAVKLFRAAQLLSPDNSLPQIGMGYLHLCKLELKQASKCFDEVLSKDPHNEMARTFLGLSLSLSPTELDRGEKILEEESKKGKDSALKSLAKDAIAFVDRFVKKAPSPATVQKTASKKKPKK